MVTTLNGQDVMIGIANDTVTVNGTAMVTIADLIADNGVVHVIDAVLIPDTITGCTNMMACNYSLVANEDDDSCEVPGDACDDGDEATENDVIGDDCECAGEIVETTTVVDIIVESEDHTVLETAVVTAGLVDALSAEGPFTVFAPTDAAFTALLEALSVTADDLLALNELTQVLTYHVAGVNALSTDLTDGQMVPTLNGQDVTIGIADNVVSINGTATVTIADLIADNGVVHVINAVLIPDPLPGCTNTMACNYSLVANEDDDSCEVPGDSCDDMDEMTVNDMVTNFCICIGDSAIFGCTETLACNYSMNANLDDGSCLSLDACGVCGGDNSTCSGCTISIACNYDPSAIIDDNSCVFVCLGCTDSEACNFDAGALQEDGTCSYPEDSGWCNCEGAVSDALGICGGTCGFDQDNDGVCDDVDDCIGIVDACGICNGPGAIYPCGCNDYPEGSCSCDGLTLVDQCGVCDGDGTSCVGCMYDFACTYDPEATIQDASQCEFGTCAGCLDPLACNYNPTVNGDDGSCEYPAFYLDCAGNCLNDANGNGVCDENEIFGCAYPSACNYDPQVTADDGSCDYSCVGSFCDADYDFGNVSWGFSPNPDIGESFAEGTVNLPYADVLHGLFPLGAGEFDPAYPPQLPIDSVLLLPGVQGDGLLTNVLFTDVETNENFFAEDLGFGLILNNPNGGASPQTVIPGEQFCISIFGVPEQEGNYRISLPIQLWCTLAQPFSVPYVFEFPLSVVTATIGCMDPNACNYQPTAVEDDGSCGVFDECGVCGGPGILEGECDCDGSVVDAIGVCGGDCPSDFNTNSICDTDEVFGCTYDSAENYDPQATSDDGTCVGFEGDNSSSCLFDGDGNGAVGSGDLLGLLTEFGDSCN